MEVRNEFYEGASGAVLVFDVSTRASFRCLEGWMEEARSYGLEGVPVVLCANKADKARRVSEQEIALFAAKHEMRWFYVSAQSGENVDEMFEHLFQVAVSEA